MAYINASGRPVVSKSAIGGSSTITQLDEKWIPAVLKLMFPISQGGEAFITN